MNSMHLSAAHFLTSGWNANAKQELKYSVHGEDSRSKYKGLSLTGRLGSAALIPLHAIGIAGKSCLYLTAAAAKTAGGVIFLGRALLHKCNGKNEESKESLTSAKKMAVKVLGYLSCAAAAPIGQVIKVMKAVGGIIYPRAYFKPTVAYYIPFEKTSDDRKILHVNREQLSEKPERILHYLAQNPNLEVLFLDETVFCQKDVLCAQTLECIADTFIDPEWSKSSNQPILKDFGKVLAHVCDKRIPMKKGLSKDLCKAINACLQVGLKENFSEYNDDELFAIMKKIERTDAETLFEETLKKDHWELDDYKLIAKCIGQFAFEENSVEKETAQELLKEALYTLLADKNLYSNMSDLSCFDKYDGNFEHIKKEAAAALLKMIDDENPPPLNPPFLRPIYEITKAMADSLQLPERAKDLISAIRLNG